MASIAPSKAEHYHFQVFLLFIIIGASILILKLLIANQSPYPVESPSNEEVLGELCKETHKSESFSTNYTHNLDFEEKNKSTCPDYFHWIDKDLRLWKDTGVTREMVEAGEKMADFRLVIREGKMYVKSYRKSFQTRDNFTIWGINQLLRLYPSSVPDLELLFYTGDRPVVSSLLYNVSDQTPPVFGYNSNQESLDIPFPDWSFWGWPEANIKPWKQIRKELLEANNNTKWVDRQPYAYWKGNPYVSYTRRDLMNCNVSRNNDYNARIYEQDWGKEWRQGFSRSNLPNQCNYRYKIYIEGYAWSASEKYILACGSVTLFVKSRYYDFFTRGLQPLKHYWPVRDMGKCNSIKFAVDWGNSHHREAEAIGRRGSGFVREQLTMENVYDYMHHLLNAYARLQRFTPRVPEGATEVYAGRVVCAAVGLGRKFMEETLVKKPSVSPPCAFPATYAADDLVRVERDNLKAIRRVERWEEAYYGEWLPSLFV